MRGLRPGNALLSGTMLLGIGILALVWGGIAFHLRSEEDIARQAAVQNLGNLAEVFEEHTIRSVKEIDKTLQFLRTAYEQNPESFDLALYTRSSNYLSDITLQIALLDEKGLLFASNIPGVATRVDLSDREHFRVHVGTSTDSLFISRPVIGRASGKPSIQLTRRLSHKDGSFAGVIVGSLDPTRLSAFYDAIEVGKSGSISLVGMDGIVRATSEKGWPVGSTVPMAALMEHASKVPVGWFLADDPATSTRKMVSYQALTEFPLIVAVLEPTADIFGAVEAKRERARWAEGVLTALILAVMGFSARHQGKLRSTRQALAESEAQARERSRDLRATLDHMSQGIMMIEPTGRVAVVNRQCLKLLDLPEHFLHSRPLFSDLLAWQWSQGEFGKDGEAVSGDVRDYIRNGGLALHVPYYERKRPDGTVLEIRSTPLPDGGIVRTYTDITERTRSSEALATARDAAEAATRARSAFLAVMSHEIRTPLNGVIGMADLLMETPLDGDQSRYARTLRTSADHLLQIINDVLDFSKLEADGTRFEQVPLDIEGTVDGVVEIMAARANEKGLFVGSLVDPDVPTSVLGDPAAIRQILLNLVGNGVKFTDAGSVVISVSRDPSLDGEGKTGLRIAVTDTGIGIPEDAKASLFKEFSQVDGTISRRFGGTGLGLAITRQLAERMGGTVGVDSTPGQGSRFWFALPFSNDPARPEARPADLSERRILVVCEDATARDYYSRVLRAEGAWVEQAAGAEDGAARLRRQGPKPYDAALVDDPGRTREAVAFAEAVRTTVSVAALPLTLVTVAGHRLEAGCIERLLYDRVLARPLSRRELVSALREPRPVPVETAAATPASTPAHRGRVLLAEDNPTNRLVIGTQVEKLGFSCHAVTNGREAVVAAEADPYDIILMDVMMPEMDGYAATRAIRALPGPAARVPIVALTANVLTADVTAALNAGMDDFATKPISRDRLEQVILRVLEKTAAPAEPAAPEAPAGEFDKGVLATLMEEIEPDSVRQIIQVFVEDTRARLEAMPKLIDDPVRISREAHAIKSAAATFGLIGVSAKAAALEQDAQRLAPDQLESTVGDLSDTFDTAQRHLMRA